MVFLEQSGPVLFLLFLQHAQIRVLYNGYPVDISHPAWTLTCYFRKVPAAAISTPFSWRAFRIFWVNSSAFSPSP